MTPPISRATLGEKWNVGTDRFPHSSDTFSVHQKADQIFLGRNPTTAAFSLMILFSCSSRIPSFPNFCIFEAAAGEGHHHDFCAHSSAAIRIAGQEPSLLSVLKFEKISSVKKKKQR
jgi:hypothetical protein